LGITKTPNRAGSPPEYDPAEAAVYTIVVTNAGPAAVTGATVSDLFTGGNVPLTQTWSCTTTGGATCASGVRTGNLADTVNIPVGGTITYTLTVTFRPGDVNKTFANTATVTPPGGITDPNMANNSVSRSVKVVSSCGVDC